MRFVLLNLLIAMSLKGSMIYDIREATFSTARGDLINVSPASVVARAAPPLILVPITIQFQFAGSMASRPELKVPVQAFIPDYADELNTGIGIYPSAQDPPTLELHWIFYSGGNPTRILVTGAPGSTVTFTGDLPLAAPEPSTTALWGLGLLLAVLLSRRRVQCS